MINTSHGMVDENLGSDCLANSMAQDPNHCRQQTLRLHDLCLEVITVSVQVDDLHQFCANAFLLLILLVSHIRHSRSRYNS